MNPDNVRTDQRLDGLLSADCWLLLDEIDEAVFIFDIDTGRILDENEKGRDVFGYSGAELADLVIADLLAFGPESSREQSWVEIRKAALGGADGLQWSALRKGREELPVEVRLKRRNIGVKGCGLAIIRDITDRMNAERCLKQTEEHLKLIAENIAEVFLIFDVELDRMIYVSPGYERVWGRSLGSFEGNYLDTIHPDDRGKVLATVKMEKKGQIIDYQYRIVRPDGSVRWIWDRGFPVRDQNGKIRHYVGVARDITERRRFEDELRFKNLLLSTQQETTIDGVLVVGEDSTILSFNHKFLDITGLSQEELANRPLGEVLPRICEKVVDREQFFKRIQYLQEHPLETHRAEIALRDGRIFDRYSAPMIGPEGKYYGRLWSYRDITDQKRTEDALIQAQKMEAIGRLAGGVAHDFNNFLTIMTGYADLALKELNNKARLREDLEQIREAGDQATNVTRQLLAFSRRQVLQKKMFDLNRLITNLVKMLRRLIGEDIQLEILADPNLGRILADPGQMEQVIINLAVNARDAMPHGGKLTIETRNADPDKDSGGLAAQPSKHVMLSLRDNGQGMNEELQSHIFEPFFTTKEPDKGTGLGLATVYGIVRQSGGSIKVDSRPGEGTSFRIYLPRVEAETSEKTPDAIQELAGRGREGILVVEDEAAVRRLTARILGENGYRVYEAASGTAALSIWRQHGSEIDVLLTDLVLPGGMSGFQLARELTLERLDLKVIYCSGHCHVFDEDRFPWSDQEFIQKPYSAEKILQAIHQRLNSAPDHSDREPNQDPTGP